MKIIEYSVVEVRLCNPQELEDMINDALKEGFQPYGNLVIDAENKLYVQAIVKYESNESKSEEKENMK